ncbi:PREDICTED: lymphokine-activated killer T-cell-originated protein kinase [Polistes dominula]|uniref:Lymphokine-activated killer T-cell-originated protein kinase n=1 Tax=Polistes dominula TaxID=743375 RepID=A0ABM1IMA6_POLDO|nr:PREDICTED: lymphokine-activated killer T-cell-originated protein kinase [Polistes dominula]
MAEFRTPVKTKCSHLIDSNLYSNPIEIPASPFLQQIGHGTGVDILKFERSPSVGFVKSPWAIKKRNKKFCGGKDYDNRLEFEAKLLKKLNHPNIVGFRAFTLSSKGDPCLAMEQLDISLGDLIESKVDKGDNIFPAKDILYVAYEMAKGLDYLHNTMHILHGDMKSFNVLVSNDLKKVKLCDFGVSVPLTETLELKDTKFRYVGTECWSAPEVLETGPITDKCDIWSYGLILWEMIALSPPHVYYDPNELQNNTEDEESLSLKVESDIEDQSLDDSSSFFFKMEKKFGTRPPLPAINLGVEYENVLDIFYTCTCNDYKLRPSAKGLLNYFSVCKLIKV